MKHSSQVGCGRELFFGRLGVNAGFNPAEWQVLLWIFKAIGMMGPRSAHVDQLPPNGIATCRSSLPAPDAIVT